MIRPQIASWDIIQEIKKCTAEVRSSDTMGNNHSQGNGDDDDSVPKYNFHETVLRSAQTEFLSSQPAHADDADNGDEYHSAEENDHDDADHSQGNEDSIVGDGRNESHEQSNLMLQLNPHVSIAEEAEVTNGTADLNPVLPLNDYSTGRSNQNDRRHCAIGNRGRRSRVRQLRDDDGNLNPEVDPLWNNRQVPTVQSGEDQMMNASNSRQFTANSPSCVSQNAPVQGHEPDSYLGKRKMLPNLPQETVLPRKKTLIRNSSKRKWLGLSDSSDSEMSETEEEDIRQSCKKRRIIVQSPKKSRRFDRDSRAGDSDERRYGKQKCRHQSSYCCGCTSATRDDEQCNHNCVRKCRIQRRHTSGSSKRRRQYNYDESSDISDDTSRYVKRHKCQKHVSMEDKSEEDRDKVETRRCYRNISKHNHDNKNSDADIAYSKGCQTHMGISVIEDNENSTPANTRSGDIVVDTVDTNIVSTSCHTFKMGNRSFRNALGKVFPLKPPHMKDAGTATHDAWGTIAAVSNVQNSSGTHNSTHSSALKMNCMLPAGKETSISAFVQSDGDSEGLYARTDFRDKISVPINLHESPFKNVVLTPSVSDAMLAILPQQPMAHKNLAGDIGDDSISDMEVEQSDITASKSTQSAHSRLVTTTCTPIPRRKKTAAVRFRHFWLEKKKNISQNLKSLFTKTNLALEKQPDTSSPIWQTFSATQAHSAWGNSLDRMVKSPSSFCDSPSSLTSPLMSRMTSLQHQQPGKFSEITSSFSPQSAPHHITPHVTDVTSVTKMSPGVFNSAGRNLQQTSLPANNLVEWLPPAGQYQVLSCLLAGVVNMSVSSGELADQKTAAIVNWTDGALTHTVTSCSRSVAARAGPLMQAACNDYIGAQGSSLAAPDVLTTPAGGRFDSSVQAILHAVEPARHGGQEESNSRALTEVYANCLRFARTYLRLHSVSCPLIGDGTFPFVTCVQSFLEAVLVLLSEQPAGGGCSEHFHVHLILRDVAVAKMAANFIKSYLECVSCGNFRGEAGSAFAQYVGHKQHLGVISQARDGCSQAPGFTVERTDSGRPRLKRPRL